LTVTVNFTGVPASTVVEPPVERMENVIGPGACPALAVTSMLLVPAASGVTIGSSGWKEMPMLPGAPSASSDAGPLKPSIEVRVSGMKTLE
jgi:hypothetical protein